MFLDTLESLMKERKLNKNSLAKESGIPYTTIDGFYKKGCDNIKLSTLTRLASFFGVSLDYLVNGEITNISSHERDVIHAYRANPSMQVAVDKLLGLPDDGPTVGEDIASTVASAVEKKFREKITIVFPAFGTTFVFVIYI